MVKPPESHLDNKHGGGVDRTVRIPDKLYFKIGEVCELTGVKQHVLRYWESEFKMLSPQRARSKQRLYRRTDVENILKIKKLLKEEGFTISGAKKVPARGKREKQAVRPEAEAASADSLLQGIKQDLLGLKKILEE